MPKTVNLVATSETIKRYFPDAQSKSGVMSASFPISPGNCRTALSRWLAENVLSTRFDDDASACSIVHPATEQGLHVRDLGKRLMECSQVRSADEAERIFADIEAWVSRQRHLIQVYGKHPFQLRVTRFQWPVFGAAAAEGAQTPEAFFDVCAGQIRATGGAIVSVGMSGVRPPQSLLRTMASKAGGGDVLVERYLRAAAEYSGKEQGGLHHGQ